MKKLFREHKLILVVFVTALFLRICMIFVGYHGDLNNNISWGLLSLERGLRGFYESGNWPFSAPNQPPLTILLFYAISYLWKIITDLVWFLNNNIGIFPSPFVWFWGKWGMIILIKLPSLLADLGIGWVIYRFLKDGLLEKSHNKKSVMLLTILWLFNPISWYNSSVWGQTDPIVNLLGLAAIFSLLNKKLTKFGVLFTLSLLFKGSLAIFVPFLFLVALLQKYSLKVWLNTFIYASFTVVLVSLWFHPGIDLFSWLFNLYSTRFIPGEIGYLTANAFNFWWLINPGKYLDSNVFMRVPYRIWGVLIFVVSTILVSYKSFRNTTNANIVFSLAITAISAFLFMTRIHERYMYPFFPVATILLLYYPKLIYIYAILSATFLLNMFNLFWIPELPLIRSLLETEFVPKVLSVVNLLAFVGLLWYFLSKTNITRKLLKKN
ncbi:MAG: hypothetical protein US62_C0005G0012 [Candidatus Woesebacteria bacterium GW2011_GWA1_37_8]|uniref:Mannosyltransferase n=2 Tax=Candidatus Woeseibacteriota TaxID=1752722 RepID=A0A0G0PBQ1_9BACT|nr:MAG: hypothetical protein US39_C0004G0013 [Microgenomates group bacterium GW2011_GWC1_37_12b]KKQ46089.1 MAG: hypothetical protein US62_C0005G0012 [Candidatus Woesebacteria bacterium GW2011_GWA1_37_8]KKQ86696.1 MAG: hypothetical protein UT10_C0018G0008 [Candidatus Woesebacteria bacterium GW2011_GWB1_38_8b]